jgi:Zn-dependent metalloprotease
MLSRLASRSGPETSRLALATLDQMRDIIAARGLLPEAAEEAARVPRKNRRVYDARHKRQAPGELVMQETSRRSKDIEVTEAFDGSGAVYDFYSEVFGLNSIDGKGKRLDSTVHYGIHFANAMWDGRQMIYGDGDGLVFVRFTPCVDIIGHEFTHGVTQFLSGLGYSGQTGALNEHISDAFGSMIKQWLRKQTSNQADWIIGDGVFGPGVHGLGIRSMAAPGTAYDDPLLGKDPQPAHMRNYVITKDDNGGVHINSGIPNKAFYITATSLGGYSWQEPGRVWFQTAKRLKADADFHDFARATVDVAGELYGNGSKVQDAITQAWALVGIAVPLFEPTAVTESGPLSPFNPPRNLGRSPQPRA